ncbi:BamA/TamA family outer membrane protein [Sphingobacteriaceae bacterium AH-315-L07]|nr:BamA/TamA family outer membrane protein [Bacteroidia bacterium]MBN4052235.1 BamA/TamA family outer membrane protein [Sphingobacteriaceae bacterium AH-315-L07]
MKIICFISILLIHLHPLFSFAGNYQTKANRSDEKKYVVVTKISIEGNKITKDHIIFRELLFNIGDTILVDELNNKINSSEDNLKNTSLFNEVKVEAKNLTSEKITIHVKLAERWYTWPIPIFNLADRNFNDWWVNQNRDLSRVDYGLFFLRYNFRGRDEKLKAHIQLGYTERFAMTYEIPYVNKKQTSGMAFFSSFSRGRELPYRTFNNKLEYYKEPDNYILKEFYTGIKYMYRKEIHNKHRVELIYHNNSISSSIASLNPDYFLNGALDQKYVSINYEYIRDHRQLKAYPLKGNYFEVEFEKTGLGLFNDVDLWSFSANYRHYIQIFDRLYGAAGIWSKYIGFNQPNYYDTDALGYNKYLRGYEYYVIDGQFFVLTKVSLKYEILKQQKRTFRNMPLPQFQTIPLAIFAGIHLDNGYVLDNYYFVDNNLNNSHLLGTGIGIDFVSFYDKILRVEYSFNKLGESDLFLHFSIPI